MILFIQDQSIQCGLCGDFSPLKGNHYKQIKLHPWASYHPSGKFAGIYCDTCRDEALAVTCKEHEGRSAV